jgi:hypothetical protein
LLFARDSIVRQVWSNVPSSVSGREDNLIEITADQACIDCISSAKGSVSSRTYYQNRNKWRYIPLIGKEEGVFQQIEPGIDCVGGDAVI